MTNMSITNSGYTTNVPNQETQTAGGLGKVWNSTSVPHCCSCHPISGLVSFATYMACMNHQDPSQQMLYASHKSRQHAPSATQIIMVRARTDLALYSATCEFLNSCELRCKHLSSSSPKNISTCGTCASTVTIRLFTTVWTGHGTCPTIFVSAASNRCTIYDTQVSLDWDWYWSDGNFFFFTQIENYFLLGHSNTKHTLNHYLASFFFFFLTKVLLVFNHIKTFILSLRIIFSNER